MTLQEIVICLFNLFIFLTNLKMDSRDSDNDKNEKIVDKYCCRNRRIFLLKNYEFTLEKNY